jgi:diacylglycerol kinase
MEKISENKKFSIIKRARSFKHAGRGLYIFIKTTHNAWIHVLVLLAVIIAGFYFKISNLEWMIIILTSGFVLTAEAFNTALEIDMNLTSPEFHPYARDTKDVSAGAVLISVVVAIVIGIFVFGKYLINFL